MIESLKRSKDKPIQIVVRRTGHPLSFTVTPVLSDIKGDLTGDQRYRVGIGSAPMKVSSLPLAAAFRRSVEQNKQGSLLILELVQKMCSERFHSLHRRAHRHRTSRRAGRKQRLTPLLELAAVVSLNLGIFNLLPIPIMDGGVILLLFVEASFAGTSVCVSKNGFTGGVCVSGPVRRDGDLQRRSQNAASVWRMP